MELKFVKLDLVATNIKGFNRTFMELKLMSRADGCYFTLVLIVPLWN